MIRLTSIFVILSGIGILPATHALTLSDPLFASLIRSPSLRLMAAADGTQESVPDDKNGDNFNADFKGPELTDRFKYKVNALMGRYDPVQSDTDTEDTDGNILQALLQFPTTYSFTIVGRTGGDSHVQKSYMDDVKKIVSDNCSQSVTSTESNEDLLGSDGNGGDDSERSTQMMGTVADIVCVVKPRGENFVKITMEVMVESAAQIQLVYEELGALERTVMTF